MSKIAFFSIPAYGHTNPTLGIVRELVQHGHEVRYKSNGSLAAGGCLYHSLWNE